MYRYEVTLRHHFQNGWTIHIYLLGFSLFPFYMKSIYGPEDMVEFIQLSILFFLLFFIPQLILHLNYYFHNKDDILLYDAPRRSITIDHAGVSQTFFFDDIELVERFKSYPLAEGRMQWFPWDSYNYSIIHLKNGKEFLVTSLLVPNMDLPLEAGRIRLRKTFYPIRVK